MATKKLSASYVLNSDGVKKGVDQANTQLSGLTRGLESVGKAQPLGPLKSALASLPGPFGEVGHLAGEAGNSIGELGKRFAELEKSSAGNMQKIGAGLAGVGATAAGIGAASMMIGAPIKQAHDQLKQAIDDSGHSLEEYGKQFDEAKKHAIKFASGEEVDKALTTLTTNMKDPALALQYLSKTEDIAAVKHISLSDAATMVGKAYANPTRLAKAFGDTIEKAVNPVKEAAAAAKAHETASSALGRAQQALADTEARLGVVHAAHTVSTQGVTNAESKLAAAQERLTDLEAVDATKKKLSIQEQQALAHAHEAVTKAQEGLVLAHAKVGAAQDALNAKGGITVANQIALRKAQDAVASAEGSVATSTAAMGKAAQDATQPNLSFDQVMTKIGTQTAGQMDASTNNLKGTLNGLKNTAMEAVGTFGNKFGPALTGAGAAASILGSSIGGVGKLMEHFSGASKAVAAGTEAMTAANEAAIPVEDAAAVSEGAALLPILLIVAAIGLVVLAGYELITHWKTVSKFLSEVWGAIEGFAKQAFGAILDFFKRWGPMLLAVFLPIVGIPLLVFQHWKEITKFLSGLWGDITRVVSGGIGSVVTAVSTGIGNVIAFFTGLPGRVLRAIGDLGNMLFDVGKQILQGLINGIESMAGSLGNVVTKTLKKIPGVAQVMGLFGSPSPLFHTIGQAVMQGMANGIEADGAKPVDALKSIGKSMTSSAQGALVNVGADVQGSLDLNATRAAAAGATSSSQTQAQSALLPIHLHVDLDGKQVGHATYTYLLDLGSVNGTLFPGYVSR